MKFNVVLPRYMHELGKENMQSTVSCSLPEILKIQNVHRQGFLSMVSARSQKLLKLNFFRRENSPFGW